MSYPSNITVLQRVRGVAGIIPDSWRIVESGIPSLTKAGERIDKEVMATEAEQDEFRILAMYHPNQV